jgi:hypothetical protein
MEGSEFVNRTSKILWLLLGIFLLFSFSGSYLRFNIENDNKNVLTMVDYREFQKSADSSNQDLANVWQDLKKQGVTTVALAETTLRDLAYRGQVCISPFGEFAAFSRINSPEIWEKAQKAIGDSQVSPVNLVVASNNQECSTFLVERLGARFLPEEIIRFDADEKSYFIINAELTQLKKTKDAIKELDTRLGFDEKVLQELKSQGFDIVLRPGNTTGSNSNFLEEYERFVRDYDVNYLVFDGDEVTAYPDKLEFMKDLVDRQELIIGIIESSVQLKYLEQKGLDDLMEDTSYPINRVYSSSNDEFVDTVDERYYRWIRGVVDRGIRILYVVPFKDIKKSSSANLADTIETIGKFHNTIDTKDYAINQPLERLSSETPGQVHRLMVSLSLLLGGLLYLYYLFKPRRSILLILAAAGFLVCLGMNILLNMDLSKIYALAAAILYPSLSSLLLLIYLRNNQQQPFFPQIMASLAIILGVNALGMYTVVSSLADIRYIMNVDLFRGVKLAFLLPLMLFVLNYFAVFSGDTGIEKKLIKSLEMKPSYFVLLLFMIAAAGMYYYLGRSGHTGGVSVSSLELRLREMLEMLFLARPRFKEIIIGYPALFAMVYLYRKYKQEAIVFVLGLAVMMGSISMVNSFCHVFTAISISASRTLAGLLTGTVFGIMTVIGIVALEWIYGKVKE